MNKMFYSINILYLKVVKTDTGIYTCDMENEYGSTKATIKVLVIGKEYTKSK